jgi:hypothetical protein
MRYYIEQYHAGKWMSLASFPTNDEAAAFAHRMHKAGMRKLRILAIPFNA